MDTDEVTKIVLPAGTVVTIQGLPFTLISQTTIVGHHDNIALLELGGLLPG